MVGGGEASAIDRMGDMVSVQLPDGSVKEYPAGSSSLDVAKSIGQRLAAACLAAEVNGKIVDLIAPLRHQVSRHFVYGLR